MNAHTSTQKTARSDFGQGSVTYLGYVAGFAVSIILTLAAYGIVVGHGVSGMASTFAVVALAAVQLIAQLFFFLHLSLQSKARWNLIALAFTILVVCIVVVGSLWIMNNLNYNMMSMSPSAMDHYMLDQQ